jgi:hypothetical protein
MISSNLNNKDNTNGAFFRFDNKKKKDFNYSSFKGWTSLEVLKFKINGNQIFSKFFFEKFFKEKNKKIEYNFIHISGNLNFKINSKTLKLSKKFDTLTFNSLNDFDLKTSKNSTFYLIKSKNKILTKKIKKFNFLNSTDVKKRDLWGGQCISRIYESSNITIVLFKLKKNFKFHDKGHANEQITWLVNGSMNFYCGKKHKKLNLVNGVDIGKYQVHGGIADKAMGFDVFYPKRLEKRYKKKK